MKMNSTLPNINTKPPKQFSYKSLMKFDGHKGSMTTTSRSMATYYRSSDVQDIVGMNRDLFPKSLEQKPEIMLASDLSGNLKSLKTSFDFFKLKCNKLEKEMKEKQGEIRYMKGYEKEKSGDMGFKMHKKQLTQKSSDEYTLLLIDEETNKQTYLHMIDRLKKDNIIFKLRQLMLEKSLATGLNVDKLAKQKQMQQKQIEWKADNALDEVIHVVEENHMNRENNIDTFIMEIDQKQNLNKDMEMRYMRQNEIAELAAGDVQDANLKKFRNLLLVHNFLRMFLKNRMEIEIQKYEQAERCFNRIKAETALSDANEMVSKWFSKEETYTQYLNNTSVLQRQIEIIKQKNDKLREDLNKLQYESNPQDKFETETNVLHDIKLTKIQEKHQLISEKQQQMHIVEERIHAWMIRQLIKLERSVGQEKQVETYYKDFTKKNISKALIQINIILREKLMGLDSKVVGQLTQDNFKNNTDNSMNKSTVEFQKRNFRMKFTKINMNGSDVFKEIRTHRQSQEGETPEILVQGEATDDMKSENEGNEKKHLISLREGLKETKQKVHKRMIKDLHI